ncbi:dihydrolipoyl dehydrogenase [Azohydromonas australica]|uniref:dihydrolipoyl dehydrogenase n=1 Tax=Azohydromonas australica TaxID=364039 RepID=UPI0003FCFE6B
MSDVNATADERLECDLAVLGAGPGGYSAAFRAADLGLKTMLIERYPTLGGVCLNVGCIPSKALLHVAAEVEAAFGLAALGINLGISAPLQPQVDLERLRAHKDSVVSKLTGGLAAMARSRRVQVLHGEGRFDDAHTLRVTDSDGRVRQLRFAQAIIAVGSSATRLPVLPRDPRVVTSTGALALPIQPRRMLVVGGGIIGLEMATVYSALGARLDVVELAEQLMPGADADLVAVWQKHNARRFDQLMLGTRITDAEATHDGIVVNFEGRHAPAQPQYYDLVLQAVGRRPNGLLIDAPAAGVAVHAQGWIEVDSQMRTNVPHIFAIGDVVSQPMLAHKAVHEGHIAAEVAAGHRSAFDAAVIPNVAYTDPELAWAGLTEAQARTEGRAVFKSIFPWQASGRALANGREEGFTKLLFDAGSRRLLGGAVVGTGAGDLISEVALAIEMGANDVDVARTIHPHPTLGETVGLAAEVAHGSCTDLPSRSRR